MTGKTGGSTAGVELRIVAGGVPSPQQEAALAVAVDRVLTERDRRRSLPEPLWGVVGRSEACDGRTVRSRAMLPRSAERSPVT
jgi:hypothetical protein